MTRGGGGIPHRIIVISSASLRRWCWVSVIFSYRNAKARDLFSHRTDERRELHLERSVAIAVV
jgi:hypothetical protein